MRPSRVLRDRLTRKRTPEPEIAKSITLTDSGLTINGEPFPHWIGTDINVDHYGDLHLVTIGIYTDSFTRPASLPYGTGITERYH